MNHLVKEPPKPAPHRRPAGTEWTTEPPRTKGLRRVLGNILFVLLVVVLFILFARRSLGF